MNIPKRSAALKNAEIERLRERVENLETDLREGLRQQGKSVLSAEAAEAKLARVREIIESYKHIGPFDWEKGGEQDRLAIYSNKTCDLIRAALDGEG